MHMKSSVLITGGCGYIGSHVTRQLSEAGYHCIVIDDLSNGNPAALLHNETLIKADYADEAALKKIFTENKISAVLHFAAFIVVPESVQNPTMYYENNFAKCLTLFRSAIQHKVKNVVFSSTAAVYGVDASQTPRAETDKTEPTSPYGRSKLMVEWLLQDLATAHGLKYAILRYFNVAGADPQGRIGQCSKQASHLIKVACQTALGRREKLSIFGDDYDTKDGTCVRDYIHIEDLASAHLLALKNLLDGGASEVFNCGYGTGQSVKEVVEMVKKVSGINFKVETAGRREGDVPSVVASNKKITSQLGWKPQFNDLEKIIQSAFSWEKRL